MATGRISRNHSLMATAFHAYFTSFWWPLSGRQPAGLRPGSLPCAPQGSGCCCCWMPQLNDVHWRQNPLLPMHAVTHSTCMFTALHSSLTHASSSCTQCIHHVFHVWQSQATWLVVSRSCWKVSSRTCDTLHSQGGQTSCCTSLLSIRYSTDTFPCIHMILLGQSRKTCIKHQPDTCVLANCANQCKPMQQRVFRPHTSPSPRTGAGSGGLALPVGLHLARSLPLAVHPDHPVLIVDFLRGRNQLINHMVPSNKGQYSI